jgi:ADP-ribose pyrophosphatase YjhB (NUDIX family)
MSIRSAAKAIIINKDKVLLNKCFDEFNGQYYSLPGGEQHTYETLHEAIIRECLEETGYSVMPKRFIALCEEICEDPKTRELYPEYIHKMYHIFLCELVDDIVKKPTEIDEMQISSEWIDIKHLNEIRLLPNALNENIVKMIRSQIPMFLGSEYIQYNHIAILNSMLGFREEEYESIIERADTIGAYRFVNLNDTIICKNFSGRDKDIKQIELIEEYLKNTE